MMGEMNRQNTDLQAGFFGKKLLAYAQQAGVYTPKYEGCVIAFASGIGLYFAMQFEPVLWICLAISGCLAGLYVYTNHRVWNFAGIVLLLLSLSLGVSHTRLHSVIEAAPILPEYERSYDVKGWISRIDASGKGVRYHIELDSLGGVAPENTPSALRIRLARTPEIDIHAGDSLTLRVIASAPPVPVVPGGYDPARRAFYQGLGGYGFAISKPQKHADLDLGFYAHVQRKIVRARYNLARRIYMQSPPQTAGLQTALMTGVRRYIPAQQTENLRVAGLAHILAISGLHMGLLAGGSYAAMTFFLALITPLSRRYDVRKFAAIIGALAAILYLILSGGSVATQRAFIMVMIVFLAVILDRRAVSMRSVIVAAFLTLLLHPESLVSVGFQMSFAAVAALVVTYQSWQRFRPAYRANSIGRKIINFFTSLSVTSFVAGLATGGFAIFHFNRISCYGFIGNLLAMPIFSLAVMPLAVVSFIAIPFGLEALPLKMMGLAISYILSVANEVASWPDAMAHVPSAPPYLLAVFAAGFTAICFGRARLIASGILVMGVCIAIWTQTPRADLRVSDVGRIAFWLDVGADIGALQSEKLNTPLDTTPEKAKLMVDSRRADRYGRGQFSQMAGRPESVWVAYEKSFANCDALACRFKLRGALVSVMKHPSEVLGECAQVDLAILTQRAAGPVARRACQKAGAVLIDERLLKKSGAQNVYITPNEATGQSRITLKPSQTKARAKRPWG